MFRNIKVIYFDFDDVLGPIRDKKYLSNKLGVSHRKYIKTIKEVSNDYASKRKYLPTIELEKKYFIEYYRAVIQKLKLDEKQIDILINRHFSNRKDLFPGVFQMLKELSKKYILGLITNSYPSRRVYELKPLHIDKIFDEDKIIISSEIGLWKPDKGVFELALKKSGFTGDNVLYVDNDSLNLNAAKSGGINNLILITKKMNTAKYPVINDVNKLPSLLDG